VNLPTEDTHYYNQKKPLQKKGKLVKSIIPKPPFQQQPTWKKAGYFTNNNQTNLDLQAKPETNLKKQPEKVLVHTGQTNNNQKERTHLSRGFITCKIKPLKSPVNKTNPKQITFISIDKMLSSFDKQSHRE
jgi:hypothetical protein